MDQRLASIRHVALDLDGTIYLGGRILRGALPFFAQLLKLGIGHTFLTNNPSKSVDDYLVHLERLGIAATPDQLYTSTQATIEYLREQLPAVRRLFALGTPSMCDEFTRAGFSLTGDGPDDEPDAVLVGFDPTLTYARLCRAAWWLKRGKPFVATNPDRVCPTDQPTVLVDCGSLCAALEHATGRVPDAVLGKPDPRMLRGILQRHALRPDQLAMVGDRLYTDMAMARRAGVLGVLVLSGETTAAEAAHHQPPLDLVVADVGELGGKLAASRVVKTT